MRVFGENFDACLRWELGWYILEGAFMHSDLSSCALGLWCGVDKGGASVVTFRGEVE